MSRTAPPPGPVRSPSDAIRRVRPGGSEYRYARDFVRELGYRQWRRMEDAIDRARASCRVLGLDPADQFAGAGEVVQFGKGRVAGKDYELTRYACYMVALNGVPPARSGSPTRSGISW